LAYTTACPYHIIKLNDKPFYAFQFHPEMNRNDLITRITRYQDRYLDDPQALQHIIDNTIHDTPAANSLLKKFIDRVILG